MADFRDVDNKKNVRDKIANHVNYKWEECYNQTLPIYDDSISKYICPKYLKKINIEKRLAKTSKGLYYPQGSSKKGADSTYAAPVGDATSFGIESITGKKVTFDNSQYEESFGATHEETSELLEYGRKNADILD